jgi:anti-sigma B factor antagonist
MFKIHLDTPGRARLEGRLDASQSDAALEVLARIPGPLVLDCAQLDYISSAGIGTLIETYKRLHREGHRLRLENVTPRVRSVFRLANLDTVLDIA